ncbi:hypothetical protein [Herbidospora galbida]|uniref:hypothetical protein n=1 Tax=Herbidospora galbida TaxID=2575442 RepID=UPI001FE37075|nr:hypothetical protein [Herbidospora galbida]
MHAIHCQRGGSVPPRPAWGVLRVEHDLRQPEPPQEVRSGQSRLTCPDHHNIDIDHDILNQANLAELPELTDISWPSFPAPLCVLPKEIRPLIA